MPIGIQQEVGYPTIGTFNHPRLAFRMTARVGEIDNIDYLKDVN